MNYLAHMVLGPQEGPAIIGSLLPDFGPIPKKCLEDPTYRKAIDIHHKIDHYTDSHDLCLDIRKKHLSKFPLHSAIVWDVLMDHFLAKNWNLFYSFDLNEFCNQVYQTMDHHRSHVPSTMQTFVRRLLEYRWLMGYSFWEGVERSLESIGNSLKSPNSFHLYPEIILNNYSTLEEGFLQFYPDLKEYCENL